MIRQCFRVTVKIIFPGYYFKEIWYPKLFGFLAIEIFVDPLEITANMTPLKLKFKSHDLRSIILTIDFL